MQRDGDRERLAEVRQGRGSEAPYLRAGRRGPGRGAPGSPAQARRRSGRSTGGGLSAAAWTPSPRTRWGKSSAHSKLPPSVREERRGEEAVSPSGTSALQYQLLPSDPAPRQAPPITAGAIDPAPNPAPPRPSPKPLSLLGNPSPGVAGWGGVGGAGGVDGSVSPSGGPWTLSSLVGVSCEGRLGGARRGTNLSLTASQKATNPADISGASGISVHILSL